MAQQNECVFQDVVDVALICKDKLELDKKGGLKLEASTEKARSVQPKLRRTNRLLSLKNLTKRNILKFKCELCVGND